jgi:Tfp pilus assembly protein PilX
MPPGTPAILRYSRRAGPRRAGSRRADARRGRPFRGGVVCIIAMVFLVLFAVLAVGFAESEIMNAQVSRNERYLQQARTSADSGMEFIRYHLSGITLPPGTTTANLLTNVASKLSTSLNGTPNLGGATITATGGVISIPSATGWCTIDPTTASRFRVTITQSGNILVVTSRGCGPSPTLSRGIQVQFVPAPRPYALIGLSSVSLSGSASSDSYNAASVTDPVDKAKMGRYVAAKARAGGSMASNGNVSLSNTAKVNGDLRYGIAGTATVASTAVVTGTTAPMTKSLSYASVTLPPAGSYTDLGDITMSSGTMTVPAGVYAINKLSLSGTAKVVWSGKTTLYIKTSYSVIGNVDIQTYDQLPSNRTLYFLPTCTTATWNGTNKCVGDLYAPDTAFTIGGSVEMFGRITAKSIANSSSGGMHYDESLAAPNSQPSYAPDFDTYIEIP